MQPTIILIQNSPLQIRDIYIKVDNECIPVPGKSIINCVDVFFKLFWIFNINYAYVLENLMYFLELIFKINKDCKPSINEMFNMIWKEGNLN
jgi:hypothetical protein